MMGRPVLITKSLKLKAAKEVQHARETIPREQGGGSKAVAKWAKKLKVSESTIHKWTRGKQLGRRFRGKLTFSQQEKISALIHGGVSVSKISELLDVSHSSVYHYRNKDKWKEKDLDFINQAFLKWKRPDGIDLLLKEIAAKKKKMRHVKV